MLSSSLSLGCPEAEPLLHLFTDGEAAPEDQALLGAHLERCASCHSRLLELQALKRALRQRAANDAPVPEALLARVRADVADAAKSERRRFALVVGAPAFAGLGALVFLSVAALGTFSERPEALSDDKTQPLFEEALSLHTLDLPVDVASPDPARVGAFLTDRIGHPMRVPRLDRAGFSLAGARVINVDNRRAAQLFYEGGLGQKVSLVTVPDPHGQLAVRVRDGAALRARRGEVTVHVWSGEGAVYSLAGKIDDERLDGLLSQVNAPDETPRTRNVRRVAHEFDPPLR